MPSELFGPQLLHMVWQHQLSMRPDYLFELETPRWATMMWKDPRGIMHHLPIEAEEVDAYTEFKPWGKESGDLYFCPNLFIKPKRRMENCVGGAVLYQDLDEAEPWACSVLPDYYWETSPNRYQAIWFLDQWLDQVPLMRLNKALNRECKADKGTWNLSRLIRIPCSWNQKRKCWVSEAKHVVVANAA